eukprot:15455066-Alexandrium_andersonii.AAC.1
MAHVRMLVPGRLSIRFLLSASVEHSARGVGRRASLLALGSRANDRVLRWFRSSLAPSPHAT